MGEELACRSTESLPPAGAALHTLPRVLGLMVAAEVPEVAERADSQELAARSASEGAAPEPARSPSDVPHRTPKLGRLSGLGVCEKEGHKEPSHPSLGTTASLNSTTTFVDP